MPRTKRRMQGAKGRGKGNMNGMGGAGSKRNIPQGALGSGMAGNAISAMRRRKRMLDNL